jgi:phosphopantothenoylcysteine decarboxylase/phosphopantothenate--cysteine ligase
VLDGKRVLLIVSGGISAYKTPELVRRLRERGARVRCVLSGGGAQFVSALTLAAVSEEKVYQDQFSLTDEAEMGHIQLSRDADLLVVAPATANMLARMAAGMADELATTVLMATDKPVLAAPAMNVRMWLHPATQANLKTLEARGLRTVGPNEGAMACKEYGPGRMAEPLEIVAAVEAYFAEPGAGEAAPLLTGRRAVVTSGPTHEPIDPVRYISNRSSGKQGHAVAAALGRAGADTVLVTGPTNEPDPPGVTAIHVESAREMLEACLGALPADIAVCAAAVADWRVAEAAGQKIKKEGGGPPTLTLAENPDILATLSRAGETRPRLVVGFAAETEKVVEHARAKRAKKGCDWILANDVSAATGTFGGAENTVHLIREDGVDSWPRLSKPAVGERLAAAIAERLGPAR